MPNPLITLLARGGVNPGIIVGSAVVAAEDEKHRGPTTKKRAIIGGIIGFICLLILIVWAVISSRRKQKRAAHGTKIAEAGGTSEESRPLAAEGYPMAGGGGGHGQAPMVLQPGISYQPPPGYAYPPVQEGYPHGSGEQGAQFHRNQ